MAYSLEIRQKALAYDDKCKNIDLVIEAFGVSRHTVFRWRRQLKETGNLSCKKPTNRPRKFDRKELLAYVEANPDKYLREIGEVFGCSDMAIHKALKAMNITLLKKTTTHKEQDPNKVKDFQDKLTQLQATSKHGYELVYIDETGIDTYLHRTHARSLKGQRAYDKVSGRRYQRVSLVAGQIGGKAKNLIAPLIYNNTMTSTLFETWFEQMLLPCLNNHTKQTGKPCIIILDNARFHRMKHLQALINNTPYEHIILPLPPYSPKLNPIEQTWATVKRWLRSHLSEFDTIE
ncbi:IS630 family transposase [Moraxella bovis]|uniref:IS630 family transposase n=1 Tax=Moraxella bovis TaxID=476 RepID=UPI003BA3A270